MAENEKELKIRITAKDEASGTIKKTGENFSGLTDTVKKVGLAAAAAAAGFVAFGINAVKQVGEIAESMDNMQKRTGLSIDSINGLRVAADQSGVSLGTMETALKKMSVNLVKIKGDSEEGSKQLAKIGLTLDDIKNKSPEESLFLIGNAIAQIKDPAEKTTLAMEFMGKSGSELMAVFGEGSLTLEQWTQKAKETGQYMGEDMVAKAQAADQAFDDFDAVMKGLTITVGTEIMPAVIAFMNEAIIPIIKQIIEWAKHIGEIGEKIVDFYNKHESLKKAVMIAWAAIGIVFEVAYKGISAAFETIFGFIDRWTIFFDDLIIAPKNALGKIQGIAADIGRAIANIIPGGSMFTMGPANAVAAAQKKFGGLPDLSNFSSSGAKPFAHGGHIGAGQLGLVGENGPELFVPSTSGTIIPNGGITINVTGNYLLDRQAGTKIGDLIFNQLRLNQRV